MPYSPTSLKTPPALKWLLTERAALEGSLIRNQKSVAILRERIAAIDVTIGLLHPEVGSARPAPVGAWQRRYGTRGEFTAVVLEKLREASPSAIVTNELCLQLAQRFELDTSTAAFRKRVRKAVGLALSRLGKQGLAERLPCNHPQSGAGLWRLRQASPLDQLRALAGTQASGHDPPVDAAGGQVDRQ